MNEVLLFLGVFAISAIFVWKFWPPKNDRKPFEYEGSPNNDKSILVRGCTSGALQTVLDEFAELYRMTDWAADGFRVSKSGGWQVIRFPKDLPPEIFIWLVNFIRYPIKPNEIKEVFGMSTLGDDFRDLKCPVDGVRAAFYVPDPDPRGDIVRVLTEAEDCWDYSWDSRGGWNAVAPERRFDSFRSTVAA